MKFMLLSTVVLAACCFGLYGRGKQEVKPVIGDPSEDTFKRIANTDEKQRLEILRQLGGGRTVLERRLINGLNAATNTDKKCAFVYLMGLYRLEGTVWSLARAINLENPKAESEPHDELPLLSKYPAVDALIRIGMPSIRAVFGRLETDSNELIVELGTMVIDRILGRELGEMAIKQAINKQTDSEKRKKLEASLEFFKNKLRR